MPRSMALGMAAWATPASSNEVRAHILISRLDYKTYSWRGRGVLCSHPTGMCRVTGLLSGPMCLNQSWSKTRHEFLNVSERLHKSHLQQLQLFAMTVATFCRVLQGAVFWPREAMSTVISIIDLNKLNRGTRKMLRHCCGNCCDQHWQCIPTSLTAETRI
jgi:hypothetical protein